MSITCRSRRESFCSKEGSTGRSYHLLEKLQLKNRALPCGGAGILSGWGMDDQTMMTCKEPARQMERLRAIMHRLRAPGGCPWDAEQTHESLISNLIEESYECVDAIRSGDLLHLREELGDLLLQVVFHSELAAERGDFTMDDVARGICDKLVHRHPHVYGDSTVEGSEAVLAQWDAIKRAEKGDEQRPYLHGVGKGLPALPRAAKLQKKAAKVGFDWPDQAGVMAKVREEMEELQEEFERGTDEAFSEELGDLLFSLVNLARVRGLDPEVVMAQANRKFEHRFAQMERALVKAGLTLENASLDQMEREWQRAKHEGDR
jgi:MazG family protein